MEQILKILNREEGGRRKEDRGEEKGCTACPVLTPPSIDS